MKTFFLAPSCLLLASLLATANSTIDATDKYAYGANIGWINLEGDDTNGVVVGEYFLSGSAYGANVGWIDFGDGSPDNSVAYANDSDDDYGVNSDGTGNLSGFAYGANIGWINFGWATAADPDRPRVDHLTGEFEGFAYGANVGWINLGAGYLVTNSLFCDDNDADGMSDAWEILEFGDTTTANELSDQDGDKVLDLDEYLGGSDPNDRYDFFRIVSQSSSPATLPQYEVTIEFSSSESRNYQIEVSDNLQSFTPSGLGTFAADPGATTTKAFTVSGLIKFYRVIALKQPTQP